MSLSTLNHNALLFPLFNARRFTSHVTCPVQDKKELLHPLDGFEERHIGPREQDILDMVKEIGEKNKDKLPKPLSTLDDLIDVTVPAHIR